jgi:hypothetical protein
MRFDPTRLNAAVLVALSTVLVAGPLAVPAAGASGSSIAPTSGAPGTTITVTSAVPSGPDPAFWATHDANVTLERDVNGGTFQIYGHAPATINAAGLLVATVQIPTTGDYIGGKPDALFHPAMPGTYRVTFPCHACGTGLSFTVTTDLSVTGQHDGTLAAVGGLLVIVGAGAIYLGRRRAA